ncbi:MAG: hypothetical protein ACJAWL_001903 [Motiliproteus sp.]|jgi:hypothetical protein
MPNFLLKNYLVAMGGLFLLISFIIQICSYDNISMSLYKAFEGMVFLKAVIIYVVAMEVLKTSILNRSAFKSLFFVQENASNIETKTLSLICAFPFGLGVSSFLKGLSAGEIDTKTISRGLTASMLLYPTTLASAYIFDFFKIDDLLSVFAIGAPICILMLLPSFGGLSSCIVNKRLFKVVLCFATMNIAYLYAASLLVSGSILIKQSIFFILLSMIFKKNVLSHWADMKATMLKQIFFFVGVGAFSFSFIPLINTFDATAVLELLGPELILVVPIVIVPMLSIFLLHPLVLFIAFSQVFTEPMLSSGFSYQQMCIAWVVMIINSQLLSPVSLATVMASFNTNTNIFTESFIKHYKYVIFISSISITYLLLLRSIN